jgi:hypothetical protein
MRLTLSLLLFATLCATACSRESSAPLPAEGSGPTAAAAADEAVSYRCDDGTMLQARYGEADVGLRWNDGRSVSLPRAESASSGAGDAFVGDVVALQRTATGIELHDGDKPMATCTEVPA